LFFTLFINIVLGYKHSKMFYANCIVSCCCCVVLCCLVVLSCIVLFCCIVLCDVLRCTVLLCIALHCIVLIYFIFFKIRFKLRWLPALKCFDLESEVMNGVFETLFSVVCLSKRNSVVNMKH
jgi:hypothetical protein